MDEGPLESLKGPKEGRPRSAQGVSGVGTGRKGRDGSRRDGRTEPDEEQVWNHLLGSVFSKRDKHEKKENGPAN